jgi:hypothetical protein
MEDMFLGGGCSLQCMYMHMPCVAMACMLWTYCTRVPQQSGRTAALQLP